MGTETIEALIEAMRVNWRKGYPLTPEAARVVLEALRYQLAGIERQGRVQERIDREVGRAEATNVGHLRRAGVGAVLLSCSDRYCGNRKRFTLDELRVPDETRMLWIGTARRFRCSKCGGTAVSVRID